MQICRQDPVTWEFKNDCDSAIDLEIGNFGIDGVIAQRFIDLQKPVLPRNDSTESRPAGPLDEHCKRQVTVNGKSSNKVECTVWGDAEVPRTYKYDVLYKTPDGCWSALLDPEFEVY